MTDSQHFERPPWYTSGAWITAEYTSPRSHRVQCVSGLVVEDGGGILTIEERGWSEEERYNNHRKIRVDTNTLEVHSVTERRNTALGGVVRLCLDCPPWKDDVGDSINLCYVARFNNQIVREGVYEFPDPDFMDMPEGWAP